MLKSCFKIIILFLIPIVIYVGCTYDTYIIELATFKGIEKIDISPKSSRTIRMWCSMKGDLKEELEIWLTRSDTFKNIEPTITLINDIDTVFWYDWYDEPAYLYMRSSRKNNENRLKIKVQYNRFPF